MKTAAAPMTTTAPIEIKPPSPDRMLTLEALRARGWSRGIIERLLGEPDRTRRNRRYRRGPRLHLYRAARVEACEATAEFAALAGRAERRRSAALKAAQAKCARLLEQVAATPITVIALPPDELRSAAIEAYNSAPQRRRKWQAGAGSDPRFLARITVNYIRHRLTGYDHALAKAAGKVGVREAVALIRRRIFTEIIRIYGAHAGGLAEECRRQMRRSGCGGVDSGQPG